MNEILYKDLLDFLQYKVDKYKIPVEDVLVSVCLCLLTIFKQFPDKNKEDLANVIQLILKLDVNDDNKVVKHE